MFGYCLPFHLEGLVIFNLSLKYLPHHLQLTIELLFIVLYSNLSICKYALLPPGFECLYNLALIGVYGYFLHFGRLVVFLCPLFILIFGLLLRFHCQHKLPIAKVKDATVEWLPFLSYIPFTVGLYGKCFLPDEE